MLVLKDWQSRKILLKWLELEQLNVIRTGKRCFLFQGMKFPFLEEPLQAGRPRSA